MGQTSASNTQPQEPKARRRGVEAENASLRDALVSCEQRLQALFAASTDAVLFESLEGRILECNDRACTLYGYPREQLLKFTAADLVPPEITSSFPAIINQERTTGGVFVTAVGIRRDGSRFPTEVSTKLFSIGDESFVVVVVRDITEHQAAVQALEASTRTLEKLHEAAHELDLCSTDGDVSDLTVIAAVEVLGLRRCAVVLFNQGVVTTRSASGVFPEKFVDQLCASDEAKRVLDFGIPIRIDRCVSELRSDWVSGLCAPLGRHGLFFAASGQSSTFESPRVRQLDILLRYAAIVLNRLRLGKELESKAFLDPLTGAFNRRYFTATIPTLAAQATRYGGVIGFLLIDINRFKEINDRLGHLRGDQVLIAVAALLRRQIRTSDQLVRFGGDEFLIVLPRNGESIRIMKQRIRSAVAGWNQEQTLTDFPVHLAIGTSSWRPSQDGPLEAALHTADLQMYKDKSPGG
ncbi:GGDEF domain-containing protein [Candidatus Bipolaricaulota bacterium]|nr:GGDEF domain-containing protein [Candidatus Bipolaricaulota bacterium]